MRDELKVVEWPNHSTTNFCLVEEGAKKGAKIGIVNLSGPPKIILL